MSNLMDLVSFVNVEADKLHRMQMAFNDSTTRPELAYPDTHVSAETRAFAVGCLQEWIRRTSLGSKP